MLVFGCHPIVVDYVKSNTLPFNVLSKEALSHEEVLELIGKSLLYIVNSISDGIPNTLLESVVMSTYPIQPNHGGATLVFVCADNGLFIENPDSILEIKT